MTATERSLPRKTIATYAIGSIGTGGFGTLPGLVLLYYMTDSLGITAIVAGAIITLAKVWDVIIDPIIGARSDRSVIRTGSRRGFMMLGGALLPVFFLLTFAVPAGLDPLLAGIWVFIAFLLAATAFSLFQVPYIALPAELTAGYDQRTRLLATRVIVLTFAILLFGAGGPALRELGGENGYLLMAVAGGLVIGVGMLVSALVAPREQPRLEAATPKRSILTSYRSALAILRRSQPFRSLLLTFVLQGLATGMMLAGAQYIATWVLNSELAVTLLFLALIAPALFFAPVWAWVAKRVGKESAFRIATVLYGVAALSMLGLLWFPGPWVYLPVALAGAAYAGMQALPMAMLPDVISHDARTNGLGAAGGFSGVWTAGETTGMAFGASALGAVLALTGYAESVGDQVVTQSPAAIAGIVLSFSVVPAVIMLVSLWPLSRYPLRRADIDAKAVLSA